MRFTVLVAFLLLLPSRSVSTGTASGPAESTGSVPTGQEVSSQSPPLGCGTLVLNSDSSYENAYAWTYGGTIAPDYGSFAECYEGSVRICSAVFDLTQTSERSGRTMDVYVWSNEGQQPGTVITMIANVDPEPISFWPSVSRHVVPLEVACTGTDAWWVGYWGTWTDEPFAWFVAADLDGPGDDGCPMTKIAPGIGFPTGWNDVSIVWGPTAALGIGAEVGECAVPTTTTSWGQIKRLYQGRSLQDPNPNAPRRSATSAMPLP